MRSNPGNGWLSEEEYAKLSREERETLKAERGAKKLAELAYGDYRDWLAGLSSVAGRNCALMEGARHARRAGVACETFVVDTVEAGGEPRLSEGEVRRAYERCKAEPIGLDGQAARRPFARPSKTKPRQPSEEERGYVRRMVAEGDRLLSGWNRKPSALLREVSGVAVPAEPKAQAVVQLRALFAGLGGKVYAGDRYGAKVAANVKALDDLAAEIEGGASVPPFVGVNVFTGEGVATEDGELSYRCAATVAAWLYALVEFDDLPLGRQAAFWLGVLATGTLDVRTITYTGGKSLHGIIRLAGDGSRADYGRIWGKVTKRADGQRDEERTAWGPLSRLLCSDLEAVEETDADGKVRTVYPYCVDFGAASVLTTRLAGCPAHEEPKHGQPTKRGDAVLLWVAKPDADTVAEGSAATYARRCADCPAETVAVCCHVFGECWAEKSGGGIGCNCPLDDVAEAWRKSGWKEAATT